MLKLLHNCIHLIPGTGEPLELPSTGWHRVGHYWSDLAAVTASAYLRLLIFLLTILIPACALSSPAFLMMFSAYKLNKQDKQYTALIYSFPSFESVWCSMCGPNCCFLSCIQVSQEAHQVVWYSHLLKNFPQFVVIHIVKSFSIVNEAEVDVFSETSLFSPWFNEGWQFDLWFLCPFRIQLVHLEVLGSRIAEA